MCCWMHFIYSSQGLLLSNTYNLNTITFEIPQRCSIKYYSSMVWTANPLKMNSWPFKNHMNKLKTRQKLALVVATMLSLSLDETECPRSITEFTHRKAIPLTRKLLIDVLHCLPLNKRFIQWISLQLYWNTVIFYISFKISSLCENMTQIPIMFDFFLKVELSVWYIFASFFSRYLLTPYEMLMIMT